MPHITVKCYKGRSREELQEIAEKIAESTAKAFGLNKTSVSVSIQEIDKENWSEVYRNEIYGDKENLFIEPGYKL